MARPQDAKPVAAISSSSNAFPMIEMRLGWPTARPLDVACEECSQTAPLRQMVEMMNAKAFRKLRFTEVELASVLLSLLLLPG